MPLTTFILLRRTMANCRRKCCYRRKTVKLSYIGITAHRQIMSENVSNTFQSYFIAVSCCKSRQLQKHSKLIFFFTQASISSLVYQLEQTVTGFQLAPDVWDNLNLYCHLNQVDVSLSRSKSKICTIFKFTCRKAIICRTIFRMYLPPCVLNIYSFH